MYIVQHIFHPLRLVVANFEICLPSAYSYLYFCNLQHCEKNDSPNPTDCPVPAEGCKYVVYFPDSDWCHLQGDNCDFAENSRGIIYKKMAGNETNKF